MNTQTGDSFVAFLDILGFRDLVTNNDHQSLARIYQNAFVNNIESGLAYGAFKVVEQDGERSAIADTERIEINSMAASDSVLFWTNDDEPKNFIRMVAVLRTFLLHCIYFGLPLRGAMVVGPISASFFRVPTKAVNIHNVIFGKSIVDAYELEQKQQWSGCVIHQECIARFSSFQDPQAKTNPEIVTLPGLIAGGLIREYAVPYKAGPKNEFVVDWVSAKRGEVEETTVRRAFSMNKKSTDNDATLTKIENTVKFVRAVNAAKSR